MAQLKMPTPQEWEAAKDNQAAMDKLRQRADSVTASAKQKRPLDLGFSGPTQSKPKVKSTTQGSQPSHYVTNSKNHTRVVKGD
jgi:hypothetical protein